MRPLPLATRTTTPGLTAARVAIVYVNGTFNVTIAGLIVDGSLANVSSGGCLPYFSGIYFSNSSGTIVHNSVRFIEQPGGLFGCQHVLAIYADNSNGASESVLIEANSVHDFQKNGITVAGVGLTATVTGNTVVGVGPSLLIAQNGIQFGPDATGTVTSNNVSGVVYSPCVSPTDGSCSSGSSTGILVYEPDVPARGSSVTVSKNILGQSQGAVYTYYDGYYGSPDASCTITQNQVSDTLVYDGIGAGFSNNTISSNTVINSAESGIALYAGGNTVSSNTIIEAPVGVLIAASANSAPTGNKDVDVVQAVQTAIPTPGMQTHRAQPFHK